MIKEFIEKYGNDKEMLLKILLTMYAEIVEHLKQLNENANSDAYLNGRLSVYRDMFDYFFTDFIDDGLANVYEYYHDFKGVI